MLLCLPSYDLQLFNRGVGWGGIMTPHPVDKVNSFIMFLFGGGVLFTGISEQCFCWPYSMCLCPLNCVLQENVRKRETLMDSVLTAELDYRLKAKKRVANASVVHRKGRKGQKEEK